MHSLPQGGGRNLFSGVQGKTHFETNSLEKINQFYLAKRNYANPVYVVATICHQVRWLRWGHPSLFHIASPLLIWYKMFCVRDISYRLIWMEFINIVSVFAQSGTLSPFNWWIIVVLTYNPSVLMCVEIIDVLKLKRKCAEPWAFVTVSGQWPQGWNIRGSCNRKICISFNELQNTVNSVSWKAYAYLWTPACTRFLQCAHLRAQNADFTVIWFLQNMSGTTYAYPRP